jgi:hypothetical protein
MASNPRGKRVSRSASLSVVPESPGTNSQARIVLGNIDFSNGNIFLSVNSDSKTNIELQTSPNLTYWWKVANVTEMTNVVAFIGVSTNPGPVFYRARVVQ